MWELQEARHVPTTGKGSELLYNSALLEVLYRRTYDYSVCFASLRCVRRKTWQKYKNKNCKAAGIYVP